MQANKQASKPNQLITFLLNYIDNSNVIQFYVQRSFIHLNCFHFFLSFCLICHIYIYHMETPHLHIIPISNRTSSFRFKNTVDCKLYRTVSYRPLSPPPYIFLPIIPTTHNSIITAVHNLSTSIDSRSIQFLCIIIFLTNKSNLPFFIHINTLSKSPQQYPFTSTQFA